MQSSGRTLILIAVAVLFGMSLWFGVSAVGPSIALEWHLDASTTTWLTLAVQLGFVAGTLLSALLNLADLIRPRLLISISSVAGAIANAALAGYATGAGSAIALRFLTGLCLAGVYPPAMKLIATWFRTGRGFALGVLIGALTLGKGSPYLINVFGSRSWRINVSLASLLALISAALILLFVREGPYALPNQPFDLSQIGKAFRNQGVRLANLGYFGHMWELYAMWTWAPVMIRASVAASGGAPRVAEAISFVVIGSGAAGCIIAGLLADRAGRAIVASVAMAISGTCCLVIGLTFGRSTALLLIVAALWGASVVADSAQFSAAVTELGDPRYLGTALTIQTCIGFLITTISIRLMPFFLAQLGWRWAFAPLAVGPAFGIIAMMRLRRLIGIGSLSDR